MIDINISLGAAYKTALTGIAGVPVYWSHVPQNESPNEYIVCKPPINQDLSTKSSSDTDTSIVVEIHTFSSGDNSGLSLDVIARDVFNRILPNPSATLTMDGAQMITTRLLGDRTEDYTERGGRGYMSRFLTFGHKIFQTADIS